MKFQRQASSVINANVRPLPKRPIASNGAPLCDPSPLAVSKRFTAHAAHLIQTGQSGQLAPGFFVDLAIREQTRNRMRFAGGGQRRMHRTALIGKLPLPSNSTGNTSRKALSL